MHCMMARCRSQHEQQLMGGDGDYLLWQALYDGRYGLPIVQRYLPYEELLREVRAERVREINFFSHADTFDIEGVCLVVFRQRHPPPPPPRRRSAQAIAPSAPVASCRSWCYAALQVANIAD